MATFERPTELPEWAINDVNLPSTNNPNKVTTPLAIRQVGVDYLALPPAEHENYWRNLTYQWIGHNTERIDTVITDLDDLGSEVDAINSFDLDFQHIGTVQEGRVDMANFLWQWGYVDLAVPDALSTPVSMTVNLSTPFPTSALLTQVTMSSDTVNPRAPNVTIAATATNSQITIVAERLILPSGITNETVRVGYMVGGH